VYQGEIALMRQQQSRLASVFSWLRRKSRKISVSKMERAGIKAGNGTRISVTNPWHAVGISLGKPCCRASMVQKNVRYLSTEAPPLPLQSCTQPKTCGCKYKHYGDRRRGPRRTTDRELYKNALSRHIVAAWSTRERRVSGGRRATDGH
jgi:hypothetical protein